MTNDAMTKADGRVRVLSVICPICSEWNPGWWQPEWDGTATVALIRQGTYCPDDKAQLRWATEPI